MMKSYMFEKEIKFTQELVKFANKEFFEEVLPSCVITFEKLRGAFGCTSIKPTLTDGTDEFFHIRIDFTLAKHKTGIENYIDTILHELVHNYCRIKEIKDVSNNNRYHNAKFKAQAERIGLKVELQGTFGWNTVGLNDTLKQKIDNYFNTSEELFNIKSKAFPTTPTAIPGETQPKDTNLQVYKCPGCGMKVRAKKNARLKCMDCDMELLPV